MPECCPPHRIRGDDEKAAATSVGHFVCSSPPSQTWKKRSRQAPDARDVCVEPFQICNDIPDSSATGKASSLSPTFKNSPQTTSNSTGMAASKVVFVGNVPYNMAEDQLIDVFKSVGQVIGFRLSYDRDTGKPKGYGFCEFAGTSIYFFCARKYVPSDLKSILYSKPQKPQFAIVKTSCTSNKSHSQIDCNASLTFNLLSGVA